MKRIRKFATLCAAMLLASTTVCAEGGIIFKGRLPVDAKCHWITAAAVKTAAVGSDPEFSDITWLTQQRVAENGAFEVTVPSSALTSEVTLLSNYSLDKYIYVSSGSASDGTGEYDSPVNTLGAALKLCEGGETVVLLDMVSVPNNMTWTTTNAVKITGKNPISGEVAGGLDLTATVALRITAPAELENMSFKTLATASSTDNANKIFACGNRLVLGEGLTMDNPIDVLGGNSIKNTAESTDVTILSGKYRRIFGGGENSPVTGDTNVYIGGNINSEYSANDDASNYYDSRIFGGGKNSGADVGGSTHITVADGTLAYIVGGGSASAVGGDTNIELSGGRVMNVYGGTVDKTTVHSGNSYIKMTGGTAESLFGGSMSVGFNGNTNINVSGGTVLRRIYAGCYNDFNGSWSSDFHVSGSTGVVIGKGCELITGGDLSWENKLNSGIFGGSRAAENSDTEVSTIIFTDDMYAACGSMIGDQGSMYTQSLLSHHDYIVKGGVGGAIRPAGGNKIEIVPDAGKNAVVNAKLFFEDILDLDDAVTEITFKDGYTLSNAAAELDGSGAKIGASLTVGDENMLTGSENLIAAVYNSENTLIGVKWAEITESRDYSFDIGLADTSGVKIRLYVWNAESLKPLGRIYTIIPSVKP